MVKTKMVVYLKGGASFEVDVTSFKTRTSTSTEFTYLGWDTPDGWKAKLHEINVTEIAAIVEKREEVEQ